MVFFNFHYEVHSGQFCFTKRGILFYSKMGWDWFLGFTLLKSKIFSNKCTYQMIVRVLTTQTASGQ